MAFTTHRAQSAACVALSALAIAGCGGSSSSTETEPAQPPAPVAALAGTHLTAATAIDYAHAVNLTAADAAGMSTAAAAGRSPAPNASAIEFARCYGGVSPVRRLTKLHSPAFVGGRGRRADVLESRVEVWPSPQLALTNTEAYLSARGRACFLHSLEAIHQRFNRLHPNALQFGRTTIATVSDPLPGVSQSVLRTIAETRVRGGRVRARIYHDIFTFVSGPAEVEFEATGTSRPVPAATEERLVELLLRRARASKV